jgi:WD40 repeat protein
LQEFHGLQGYSTDANAFYELGEISSTEKKELVWAFSGHRDCVYPLAEHEATKRIVSGSYNGEVRIWKLEDGKLVIRFVAAPGHRSIAGVIRLCPNGSGYSGGE